LLFGVTTRAEVGRFLAGGGSGNSNSIAREICLSQRGVFETLRDLEAVELVEARREGRAKVYTAAQGLLHFAAASGKTFFNWANYSSAIAEALRALERWPQAQSEYQRNSLITTAKERFFERLEKSSWNRRFFRRQPDLGRGPEHLDHFLPSHPFGAGSA
jgi:predicted transcriptional regulator